MSSSPDTTKQSIKIWTKKSAKTENKEIILPVETNEFKIPENFEYYELYVKISLKFWKIREKQNN